MNSSQCQRQDIRSHRTSGALATKIIVVCLITVACAIMTQPTARANCDPGFDRGKCFCGAFIFDRPIPWVALGPVLLVEINSTEQQDQFRVDEIFYADPEATPTVKKGDMIPVISSQTAAQYIAFQEYQGTESNDVVAFPISSDGSVTRLIGDGTIDSRPVESGCTTRVNARELARHLVDYAGKTECLDKIYDDFAVPRPTDCSQGDSGGSGCSGTADRETMILVMAASFLMLHWIRRWHARSF